MERKQKTYQSTQAIQLDTYVMINGQRTLIEFRGGTYDPRKHGLYRTSDPDIIKALDADIQRVGAAVCTFKCVHEETLIDDDPIHEPLEEKSIPDIKTVTAAKAWLIDASEQGIIKKGITPGMIRNRTDVLTIARENAVTFTDLPQES
jgi:hypothetical protein